MTVAVRVRVEYEFLQTKTHGISSFENKLDILYIDKLQANF